MHKHFKAISIFLITTILFTFLPIQTLAQEIGTAISISKIVDVPPIEDTKKPEPKILEEVTNKREKNMKHFLKEDMSLEADVYPTAVHYMENGTWKDIDNTLVDEQDEENTAVLSNKANKYKVKMQRIQKQTSW